MPDSITILSYKIKDLEDELAKYEERLKTFETAILKFNEMFNALADDTEAISNEIDNIKWPLD